ncbi:BTB/POZ domain-containing protein [Xylariaceae sp. FL0594]|nr:BTB/POZ domain-containing protein [Xylariaceae sp. FL0594]
MAWPKTTSHKNNLRTEDAGVGYFSSHASYKEPEMTDSKRSLAEGIAKLFNNSDHADVKIYLGQHELPAHSVVLASQSSFFQKALSENFREGKAKQFLFKEGSVHAHWRVFEYLYTGNYAEEPVQVLDTQDDNELVRDVRVYVTAEFFMLDGLKQFALRRFTSKLEQLWVSELLVDCIREVYESTTESEHGLRSAVVEVAEAHRVDLWGKKAFRDLIREGGDFAVDLMGKFCLGQ